MRKNGGRFEACKNVCISDIVFNLHGACNACLLKYNLICSFQSQFQLIKYSSLFLR